MKKTTKEKRMEKEIEREIETVKRIIRGRRGGMMTTKKGSFRSRR